MSIWVWLVWLSFSAVAAVDVEQTMKNMAFHYKQAKDIEQPSELVPVLAELISLTEQAMQANFADDKATQYMQGLQQVLAALKAAKNAAEQDDVVTAKRQLQQVDTLRKEYHQLRKVSFWQLLFG